MLGGDKVSTAAALFGARSPCPSHSPVHAGVASLCPSLLAEMNSMLAAVLALSKGSTHTATVFLLLRLDRELTLSASINSTMACTFISVTNVAIGLRLN